MKRDENGNVVLPRWLIIVGPFALTLFAAGATWGVTTATLGGRIESVRERAYNAPTDAEFRMLRDLLSDMRDQLISYQSEGRDMMARIVRLETKIDTLLQGPR